ncbi:MAG: Outer membrane protein P6 [Chlamydiae bacterium]|nr:Outer membrane protein P6 [Chlamydiota bacterium]
MRRLLLTAILGLMGAALFPSCVRTSQEVWEDTKTCGRYWGKGTRSLFGRHDREEYVAFSPSWETQEADYVPLSGQEEELSTRAYPLSQESPGDPDSKIPGVEGFSAPSGKLAAVIQNIHFATDNYSVKGTENLKSLKNIAGYLVHHPNTYLFVEGHADERGASAYNLALGSRRSNSVRNFLIQNGVNPDQLFSISYGLERPVAMGHDESIWSKNRRAQFRVYER